MVVPTPAEGRTATTSIEWPAGRSKMTTFGTPGRLSTGELVSTIGLRWSWMVSPVVVPVSFIASSIDATYVPGFWFAIRSGCPVFGILVSRLGILEYL